MTRAVRRHRKGYYEIRLPETDRALLRSLAPQMRELLASDDPVLDRLYPVAYPDDIDRETEYRLLVRDELRSSHEAALTALEESADAERLDDEQLQAWMRAVNEVRLVLGTRLDVTEEGHERPTEPDDPRSAAFAVYDYLTWLQATIVEALSP
ncbi:MAG TPA: DUF2017 family protein [Acidimicrobiales bacterium]|nr:DUF2017 family protein [Acidimicrobiales bacterium]